MEEIHALNYHGNYSWSDILCMTSKERLWLLERLKRQFEFEAKQAEAAANKLK